MKKTISFLFLFSFLFNFTLTAQKASEPDSLKNISLAGLKFRSIGPAITGGRISAIAVNPRMIIVSIMLLQGMAIYGRPQIKELRSTRYSITKIHMQ